MEVEEAGSDGKGMRVQLAEGQEKEYKGFMSISAGITAAKASLDLTKVLMDLVNRPQIDAENVRSKLHEMLIHLVNAQVSLGEAQVEISDLRHIVDERQTLRALQEDMDFEPDGGFLLKKSEKAVRVYNPHCPVCWGSDQKAVPLKPTMPGSYFCVIHKCSYVTEAYREAQRKQASV
jgi:polyhydroxyalkanoate synthesis regulator phasin